MSVRAQQMPFGKNKHLAPRAKKKEKVAARSEASNAASKKADVEEELRNGAAVEPSAPAEVPAVLSPGGVKRREAEAELDELAIEYEAWQEMDSEAAKALALAQRLYDAKVRRIDKSQAGKRHGSPFGELERIYSAELELLRARLARSESEGCASNAEANWLAQQCRVLRLQNAKMQRTERKLGGVHARK